MMEHLGLGLLSASLANDGHDVIIVDCYALNKENDHAVSEAVRYAPDFVGITANYLNFDSSIEIGRQIRQALPNVYLVYGGEHCTYSSTEILVKYPFVNAIVRGEGERTIQEVVNKAPHLKNVLGVHFRDQNAGVIVKNPERPGIEDLDLLPVANRVTQDYCKEHDIPTAIGILAQRGCNYQCKFCNAFSFFRMGGGLPIRRRSVKNVAYEMEILFHRYFVNGNIEKLYFYDANFIDGSERSKEWAIRLANEIVAREIIMPFEIYLRGDSLKKGDDDVLIALKKSGLEAVFVGIESFDENDLEFYGKKISLDSLIEGLDLLQKHRVLGPTAGVIMFNPYSTDKSLIQTADLLERYEYASFWNLTQRLQLFPGVNLVEELKEKQLITGYDSANKVYSYLFQDKRVEALSKYFFPLNQHPQIIRDNSLPRHVTTELLRIIHHIEQLEMNNGEVDDLVQPVWKKKREINALNVAYFKSIVHDFFSNEDMKVINYKTSQYIERLSIELDDIDKLFNNALQSLYNFISSDEVISL
jgi:radical SAM superfamily enzyme YgiQ (UPF0313 family)